MTEIQKQKKNRNTQKNENEMVQEVCGPETLLMPCTTI